MVGEVLVSHVLSDCSAGGCQRTLDEGYLASISGLEEAGASIEDCGLLLAEAWVRVRWRADIPIGASAILEVCCGLEARATR